MDGLIGNIYGIKVVVDPFLPFTDSEGNVHHYILVPSCKFGNSGKEKFLAVSKEFGEELMAKTIKAGD